MATNIELDGALVTKAMRLGGARTKRDVVREALTEYVQRREQARITELFGAVAYDPGFHPKKHRRRP
jgi:Arc/MetJ family transcription regulator